MDYKWFYGYHRYPKIVHTIMCSFGFHRGYQNEEKLKWSDSEMAYVGETFIRSRCVYCDYGELKNKKGGKV